MMTIQLWEYLVAGVLAVKAAQRWCEPLMQWEIIAYRGTNRHILFWTRDVSDEGRMHGPRVVTLWNVSHVLYSALGSYLFPGQRLMLWTILLLWELLEHFTDSMNPLDIWWNTLGIGLGALATTEVYGSC